MILSSRTPRSSLDGGRKLMTVISLSSSAGISITGEISTMVLKLFLRCRAMSLRRRMTAKLFRVRKGWKSLNRNIAGSTWSMTMSRAARGSLVAVLRFFCDWMEAPAGTMPEL